MSDVEMNVPAKSEVENHSLKAADAKSDESLAASGGKDVDTLHELIGPLREAQDFAAGWPEPYRKDVFRIAASYLLNGTESPAKGVQAKFKATAPPGVRNEILVGDASERLSSQLGVERTDVERVIHFGDDGSFQILPRIEGSSNRERQILYSLVYCYVQEIALGTRHVDVDELRKLCIDNGCYDGANFSSNFKKASRDDLLREIDKGDRARKYMATKKGLEAAAALLRQMLEA